MRALSFHAQSLSQELSCLQASAVHGRSSGPERSFVGGQISGVDARLALYCGLFWRLTAGSARVAWIGEGWSAVTGRGVTPVDAVIDAQVRVRPGVGALRELRRPRELVELLERLPGERPVVGLMGVDPSRLLELAELLVDPWPILELLDGGEAMLILQLARIPGERDLLRLISPDPNIETTLELALVDLNGMLSSMERGHAVLAKVLRGGGLRR